MVMSFDLKEFHDVETHLENYSPKDAFQCSDVGSYYYLCYHKIYVFTLLNFMYLLYWTGDERYVKYLKR